MSASLQTTILRVLRRKRDVARSVEVTRSLINRSSWRAIGALLIVPAFIYLPLAEARWTMVALAPLVAAFNLVVNQLVRGGRPMAAWLSMVGFAAIVLTSMLVPQLWVPIMMLLTANVAFVARWLGRKYAVSAIGYTIILLAVTAMLRHQPNAIGGIALWAFSAACTIGIIGDARNEAENRVALYANMVESVALGMVIVAPGKSGILQVQALNPAMRSFTTRPLDDLVGLPVADAFSELFDSSTIGSLAAVANGADPVELGPTRIQAESIHYIRLRAFPLTGGSACITMEDATAWQLATAALSYQTNHDALSGLPNRPNVIQRLGDAIATADPKRGEVSLLLIDLDRFRQVNDTFGHHEGDRLLIELGRRLKAAARRDVVGRIGGDEFAVIVSGVNAAIRADALAEWIRQRFLEPFEVHDLSIQTSAAIGIATYPTDAHDAAELMQRAELAMYAAKKAPDRIVHYLADEEAEPQQLGLLSDFHGAITAGEFTTAYQPIFDLASGALVGAETLVRWQHPEHGLLAPAQFLSLAEKAGLVGRLTEAVAAAAIADAARWHRAGRALSVTINLSSESLHDHRTASQLLHLLELADLPASALRVEVTEQALLDDPATAAQVLSTLRAAGTEVSIDDFGTGYSSLSLLRQLPIDELKIDNTFVSALTPHDTSLVRSIVDLGHALGLRVVAEGIESQSVCDILAGLGCDRGQGFYLGQPMTPDQFFDVAVASPRPWSRWSPGRPEASHARGATVTQLSTRRTSPHR